MIDLNLYVWHTAKELASKIAKSEGDHGSCVMGYHLLVDGVKIINQPAQGSGTCDAVYGEVAKFLIENGVHPMRITRRYGVMD